MKKSVTSIEEVKRALANFCVYQERCYQDIEKKLATYNIIPQVKEEIILYLLQNNFLNEERFAKNWVSGKINKKWGKRKIEYQLRMKGISERNIQLALATIDNEIYKNTLLAIAIKKTEMLKEESNYKKKIKLTKYLQSKGFETELIFEVVQQVISS